MLNNLSLIWDVQVDTMRKGENTLQVNLCEEASALSPIHLETTWSHAPPPYRRYLGCLMLLDLDESGKTATVIRFRH